MDFKLVEGKITGPVWAIGSEPIRGKEIKLLQLRIKDEEPFCPIFTEKHKAREFAVALGAIDPNLLMVIVYKLNYFPAGGLAVIDIDPYDFQTHYGGDLRYINN